MRRVLVVDDEQRLLDGLAVSLRRYRARWALTFACGGKVALEILAAEPPFEVVVTDCRMPGVDGEAVLREVQKRHPDTVRLMLSGESEEDQVLRVANVVHQFLAKPCDSSVLFDTVERTCVLRDLVAAPEVRALITQAGRLPALPDTYARLSEVLARPNASVADVARLIERDPALSAKLLQLVNSAFFGLPQRVSRILPAASFLGLETIRAVTLSLEVLGAFANEAPPELVSRLSSTDGLRAAAIARSLAPRGPVADVAFTACMLRDVGQLLLATRLAPTWLPVYREAGTHGKALVELERARLKCDHGQLGAYLLSLWGLPPELVYSVATHHGPVSSLDGPLTAPQCVYLASAVVDGDAAVEDIEAAGLTDPFERARHVEFKEAP